MIAGGQLAYVCGHEWAGRREPVTSDSPLKGGRTCAATGRVRDATSQLVLEVEVMTHGGYSPRNTFSPLAKVVLFALENESWNCRHGTKTE